MAIQGRKFCGILYVESETYIVDEETLRTVVRATIEDMDIKCMTFTTIRDYLKDEIDNTVNEMIADIVEQIIDTEVE